MTTNILGNSINVPKFFPLGCLVALVLLALSVGIVNDSGNLSNFRSWDFLISLMPGIYHFMYITTFGHYGNSKFLPTRVAPTSTTSFEICFYLENLYSLLYTKKTYLPSSLFLHTMICNISSIVMSHCGHNCQLLSKN